MGVYIKDMEMPTRCCECRLSTCNSFKERPLCDVLVEYMSYGEWEAKRLDNCPLVPVQKHGDLIERDKLIENCMQEDSFIAELLFRKVNNAPTIIPAEGGE